MVKAKSAKTPSVAPEIQSKYKQSACICITCNVTSACHVICLTNPVSVNSDWNCEGMCEDHFQFKEVMPILENIFKKIKRDPDAIM